MGQAELRNLLGCRTQRPKTDRNGRFTVIAAVEAIRK